MAVAPAEGVASGPAGGPGLLAWATVSNRSLEAERVAFVNQQLQHARKRQRLALKTILEPRGTKGTTHTRLG